VPRQSFSNAARKGLASLFFCLAVTTGACAGDINGPAPWNDSDAVIVLDAFQENWVDIPTVSSDPHHPAALVWQITKGHSQSVSNSCNPQPVLVTHDCKFLEMYTQAKKYHYLFGAYHFGHTGHVNEQIEEFLKAISGLELGFIALDVDGDADGINITIPEAEKFLQAVQNRTHMPMVLYTTRGVAAKISAQYDKTSIFAKSPLWIAAPAWAPNLTLLPPKSKVWENYALWQFNDDVLCVPKDRQKYQKEHPGKTLPPCQIHIKGMDEGTDVSVFNGSLDALKTLFSSRAP